MARLAKKKLRASAWPWPLGLSERTGQMVAELTKDAHYPEIEFQGKKFILVEGAITTLEDFHHFRCSYAHLHADGNISRFGQIIGHREDITFL